MSDPLGRFRQFIDEVDRICDRLSRLHAETMVCAPGCDDCCRVPRSVLPIEGAILAEALSLLPEAILREQLEAATADRTVCPLLSHGHCIVYQARPLICRTHGLPLLIDTGEEVGVDYCQLNFTTRDRSIAFEEEEVLDTASLNGLLAGHDADFRGTEIPPGRIDIYSILYALSGQGN